MIHVRLRFRNTNVYGSGENVFTESFDNASDALHYVAGYIGAYPMTIDEFEVEDDHAE